MRVGALSQDVIGREPEQDVLARFFAPAHAARALVLCGGAGIGKTTLWEAGIAAAAARSTRVLTARPTESEARLSHAALADLLEGIEPNDLATLTPPQRRALDVALLRTSADGRPPELRALATGVLHVLDGLGRRGPTVVAIDDVHLLDRASADALVFAARRLKLGGIRFLLSIRSGHTSPLLRVVVSPSTERVDVSGLSLGAIRRLLAERLGFVPRRRAVRWIHELTEGNPLFALEVARVMAENGRFDVDADFRVPDSIEEVLGVRVRRLPRPTRRLLLALALSPDLRWDQLAELVDEATLDDAVDRGLVVPDSAHGRIAHPLIASVVRGNARTVERRALHREIAQLVDDPELSAKHLALATTGVDDELACVIAGGARIAAARGAADDAVALAEHALRLTSPASQERMERLVTLGELLMVTGEHERARALVEGQIDRLPSDEAVRARAHLLLSESSWTDRHSDAAQLHLEHALAMSKADPSLHALVSGRWVRHLVVGRVERIEEAVTCAELALPAARAAGPAVEREVLHGLAWARLLAGLPLDDLLRRFGSISQDAFHIFRSLDRVQAERCANRGDLGGARAILRELLSLADDRGDVWSYAIVRHQLCEVELRAGDWAVASSLLEEWDESDEGHLVARPGYDRCRAALALGRGDAAEASRHAASALAASERLGYRWSALDARRIRGAASLLAQDPSAAVTDLRAVWEHTQREGVADPGVFPVAPELVDALAELGELHEAQAVLDRLTACASEDDHPWARAGARRGSATIRFAAGTYEPADVAAVHEAFEIYDVLGCRFDAARTLLSLGRWERRLRKWAASRRSLQAAAAAFADLDSPGWLAVAQADLARVGGRRPREAGKLTPSEDRVADLAAFGHSNKEIAARLFVSVHTVEAHLSRAYAKLGVRSRAQLARALAGGAPKE